MSRPVRRRSPTTRFLWDENLSAKVPQALAVLGHRTTWVGDEDRSSPQRGSSDAQVIQFAQNRHQVIVTSNHDMITLCAELDQRFVWLDPRGRQLDREQQVLLVFRQIWDWDALLQGSPPMSVHALRTKCEAITAEDAARRARNRMVQLQRRQGTRKRSRLVVHEDQTRVDLAPPASG